MDNPTGPKKILKSTHNKLFASIPESIHNLQAQIDEVRGAQQELQAAQKNILSKVQNSGYIRVSDTEIMTKIFSGAKMYVDPRDVGLVPHLILDGEWEHDITLAWLSVLKENDVVLDIGANFGYFGVLAAQQTNRSCKAVLFEANPNLIPYLHKTMTVNSFGDCATIENSAVSDKQGRAKLNILKDYLASSSLHDAAALNEFNANGAELEVETSVDVPATTVDIYCKENSIKAVNVIKMDIEGYEDKAYDGMRKTVKNSPDITLFIEFTKQAYAFPEKFYDLMLKDFGHVYQISREGRIVKPKKNDYESVIGSGKEWSMPVFSKKSDLAG